jgi:hypothetical protein
MKIDWRAGGVALILAAALAGCGSYSAPSNTNMAPDSAGDTTSTGPGPYGM